MSLAVVNFSGTSTTSSVGTQFLGDLNLSAAQTAQVEQILAELQSGMLSPVEARAQIASVVTAQQQTSSGTSQPQLQASSPSTHGEPLQQYYELPLPQESLKGAIPGYNSQGVATDTVFSAPKSVNASA